MSSALAAAPDAPPQVHEVEVRPQQSSSKGTSLLDSALLTTLAGAMLYVVGSSYDLAVRSTLGVPYEVTTFDFAAETHTGFVVLFEAVGTFAIGLLLILALGPLVGPRLAQETRSHRFLRNVFNPRKVAQRLPRWIVPFLIAGTISTYAWTHATGADWIDPEESGWALVQDADVMVLLLFVVVVGRDRPARRHSFFEAVRRGGAPIQIFTVAAALLGVASYAYALGQLDTEVALYSETPSYVRVSFEMKEPGGWLDGRQVLLVYQTASAYYVRPLEPLGESTTWMMVVPAEDVRYIYYI